jgi:hypothetical protein
METWTLTGRERPNRHTLPAGQFLSKRLPTALRGHDLVTQALCGLPF